MNGLDDEARAIALGFIDTFQEAKAKAKMAVGHTAGLVWEDLNTINNYLGDPRNGWIGMNPLGRSLQEGVGLTSALLGKIVFHGSPHKFEKFAMSKVGTGESGGTSFGLGINLSADPRHAKVYAGDKGHLYKVDLPDESLSKFIEWEKPVPKEIAKQLPPVDLTKPIPFGGGATVENVDGQWMIKTGTASFKMSPKEFNRMFGEDNTGEQVYRRLVAALGDERAASQWLNDRGIKGTINHTERGAENYVVFDEALPKIVGRE